MSALPLTNLKIFDYFVKEVKKEGTYKRDDKQVAKI